ncbi:MAG: FAD-binding protein [Myxococcales bacterium]|nr:FAD-binding protein [Myxococcales bacterium]MCB9568564.1 electron transfer flavoprotein subunit alpha/FixB family protein [Myxococcales bacterium]
MSKVLVVLETAGNGVRSTSLPGITCGQQIAKATGGELHLLVLGADPAGAAQAVAAAGYGAKAVHVMASPALEPFTAEAWADAIVHAARTLGATHVGGTATSSLRDALPRAAALLDAPLCPEAVAVKSGDTFTRPVSAGRALLDLKVKGAPIFFTARGTEFEAPAAGAAAPVAAMAAPALNNLGVQVLSIQKTESARPALTEARVIVSGGRGMGSGANFAHLEKLTDALGGALGASRAATDAGMVPADLQVGQTGKIVAPELYIAVAISGAIQHLAGMKGSKVIVAINKDAEAPIFQLADYGLVAKWEDTIPRLTQLVSAHRSA